MKQVCHAVSTSLSVVAACGVDQRHSWTPLWTMDLTMRGYWLANRPLQLINTFNHPASRGGVCRGWHTHIKKMYKTSQIRNICTSGMQLNKSSCITLLWMFMNDWFNMSQWAPCKLDGACDDLKAFYIRLQMLGLSLASKQELKLSFTCIPFTVHYKKGYFWS